MGAEIGGVDLSQELDESTVSEIRRAFLQYQVLFFRDQNLTPETQIRFGRQFGELDTHPFVEGMDEFPQVIEVITEPEDTFNFGGGWHTDVTFLEEPDLGSILYALEVPPYGGDTLFANQYAAYEALSDTMKALIGDLIGIHSAGPQYSSGGYSTKSRAMRTKNADSAQRAVRHPIVRTHPETGRKGLYVNGGFTVGIEGMRADESAPLLEYLFSHATREQFTCRFRWRAGSLAMWDNRCVQHYALFDFKGQRRHMRRVTVRGDRPF